MHNLEKITYRDAFYSHIYKKSIPNYIFINYGRLLNTKNNYKIYQLVWSKDVNKTIIGIVIPYKSGKEHEIFLERGEQVEVNWNDVFVFNNEYRGKLVPTQMLTKGEFLKFENGFYFIKDPITVNLNINKLHPENSVRIYCIPEEFIINIKIHNRNEKNK
jgi:hypothetical protein